MTRRTTAFTKALIVPNPGENEPGTRGGWLTKPPAQGNIINVMDNSLCVVRSRTESGFYLLSLGD